MTVLLADLDWLVTSTGSLLHAPADHDEAERHSKGVGSPDEPSRLACGLVKHADIPGPLSRLILPRCRRCCTRTGYPFGKGSPKNDAACRRILGLEAA